MSLDRAELDIINTGADTESIANQINETRGLGFDDWDLDFYEKLFKDKLGRDPTDVELFDMGQVRGPGHARRDVMDIRWINTLSKYSSTWKYLRRKTS